MSKINDLVDKLCPNGVRFVKLEELCPVMRGKRLTKSQLSDRGKYVVYHGSKDTPLGFYDDYNVEGDTVIVVNTGGIGGVKYNKDNFWCSDGSFWIKHNDKINNKFLYYYLVQFEDYYLSQKRVGGVPTIDKSVVSNTSIPVPPLEVQNEIVKVLDDFTLLLEELSAELNARQKQYEYYKGKLFNVENAEYKTLKDLAKNCDNQRKPVTSGKREKGEYPYYGASGIVDYVNDYIFDGDYLLISEDGANLVARKTPIAFSISGKNWVNNHAHVLKFDDMYLQKYVEMYLNYISLEQYISGAAQPKLNQENLNKIQIPIPDEESLIKIVEILTKFDRITNDTSEGIPAEINARTKQYEFYRNILLTFKELKVSEVQ